MLFSHIKKKSNQSTTHLSYNSFKYLFTLDLQAIGIDKWSLYGTHSFRWGGSQYFLYDQKKTINQIRNWGGWTDDTIYRYLSGLHDTDYQSRSEFTIPVYHKVVCPKYQHAFVLSSKR